MKVSQEIGVSFYQNFGKLLYAIAAADKHVHEDEYVMFKEILQKELDKMTSDYASYGIFQAQVCFAYCSKSKADVDECFNDFIEFKRANESLFTNEIKRLVNNAAIAVATVYSNKNKSELVMLGKLDLELNKKY